MKLISSRLSYVQVDQLLINELNRLLAAGGKVIAFGVEQVKKFLSGGGQIVCVRDVLRPRDGISDLVGVVCVNRLSALTRTIYAAENFAFARGYAKRKIRKAIAKELDLFCGEMNINSEDIIDLDSLIMK